MQHFLKHIQRGAAEGHPLCIYFTNAANNALNDAAGCWLLAAAAAGAVAAAAVAAVAAAVVADLFNRIIYNYI